MVRCYWCVSIPIIIPTISCCSLTGPLCGWSAVVPSNRRYPSFRNFDSTISIDVIRMKSYMNSLFDPTCVPVRVTINKLNFFPDRKMPLFVIACCTAPQMIPRPQMIPDRKWSPNWTTNDPTTANDPHCGPVQRRKWSRDRKWSPTANDPRPQMIPDRKWSPNWTANDPRTTNDPHSGPQMIPLKKFGMAWSFSEGENTGRWKYLPK